MPNKVTAYYTTDHKPRHLAISSDYIKSVRYDRETMCLYVIFHNDQEYKYYQVPEDFYTGMLKAGSHGTHFYHTIRQMFNFDLLDENGNVIRSGGPQKPLGSDSSNNKPKPILGQGASYKAIPELVKLDTLDQQEFALNRELKKGIISQCEYDNVLNVIKNKRDKLIKKLEKDGYFPNEIDRYQQEQEEAQIRAIEQAIAEAKRRQVYEVIKKCIVFSLLGVGIVLGWNNPGIAFIVCMAFLCWYYR